MTTKYIKINVKKSGPQQCPFGSAHESLTLELKPFPSWNFWLSQAKRTAEVFRIQTAVRFRCWTFYVLKGGVTLVNLQRQLAMIRCCAKNHSSVTARCERFFAIFAVLQRVASFWKQFKSVTCLQIRVRNMRCESALQVFPFLAQSLQCNSWSVIFTFAPDIRTWKVAKVFDLYVTWGVTCMHKEDPINLRIPRVSGRVWSLHCDFRVYWTSKGVAFHGFAQFQVSMSEKTGRFRVNERPSVFVRTNTYRHQFPRSFIA